MKIRGIIFDFNGTLLFDSDKHEKAWRTFAKEYCSKEISDDEFEKNLHGVVNKKALEYLYERPLSNEEVLSLEQKKEEIYRRLVSEDKENFRLVPGAVEFLDFISKENIPHTIATASEIKNLEFYIKAAETIGISPENCLVFEDSKAGLTAAHSAGIGKITAVASTPEERKKAENIPYLSGIINNFYDFDISILKE